MSVLFRSDSNRPDAGLAALGGDLPDGCIVISDFLSREECAAYIAQSETRGFRPAGSDYPPSYRNNDRQVFDSVPLADALLARIERRAPAVLPGLGPASAEEHWRLAAVNERFRLCRYTPGQRFAIHQDGVHHRGPDVRSRLTFMVYLTDGDAFSGGDTLFYAAGPGGGVGGQPPRITGRLRPRAGMLVLFDHALWHAGDTVTAGVKHILRSDVLYRREPTASHTSPVPFQPGHAGFVWTMARLADGRVASGGRDGTIRIWDAHGRQTQTLAGHDRSVLGLAALADGSLASVSRDRTLRLWEPGEARCRRVVVAHDATVLAVNVLPGEVLATAGGDGLVRLWDATGEFVGERAGHAGWVWEAAALSPAAFASASEDGSVRVWDRYNAKPSAILPGDRALRALVATGTGDVVLTGDIAGEIACWERRSDGWCRTRRIRAHGAAVRRLRLLSVDTLASAGEDCRVRLWRLPDLEPLSESRHDNFATDVLAVGDSYLSCSYDGRIVRRRLHAAEPSRAPGRLHAGGAR